MGPLSGHEFVTYGKARSTYWCQTIEQGFMKPVFSIHDLGGGSRRPDLDVQTRGAVFEVTDNRHLGVFGSGDESLSQPQDDVGVLPDTESSCKLIGFPGHLDTGRCRPTWRLPAGKPIQLPLPAPCRGRPARCRHLRERRNAPCMDVGQPPVRRAPHAPRRSEPEHLGISIERIRNSHFRTGCRHRIHQRRKGIDEGACLLPTDRITKNLHGIHCSVKREGPAPDRPREVAPSAGHDTAASLRTPLARPRRS